MKVQIEITGQINGNCVLFRSLSSHDWKLTRFNGYLLNYNSITEAKKDLRSAWKLIKITENPTSIDGLNKNCTALYYDASKAIIVEK